MILLPLFDPAVLDHVPVRFFLPLVIAGLFTAAVFAMQWFAGVLSGRGNSSQQDHSTSRGASQ